MGAPRMTMRRIKEILRMRMDKDQPVRDVARAMGVSLGAVSGMVARAKGAGLGWSEVEQMDDVALERLLYPSVAERERRPLPDFKHVHAELRRKGVTLMLLWEEYQAQYPEDHYGFSQFCQYYRAFASKLNVVMRHRHRAGEKMFVDYSGDGIPMVDPESGEVGQAELFVAVLGASDYMYAEATASQQLEDWIDCHIHAYEFFDGVPEITVPDQTRTAVKTPCYYEPEINPTYLEMSRHYDTTIIPARPRKPKDKAKAEGAVLVAQRRIIAALRNQTLFGLVQVKEAVALEMEKINTRPMKMLGTTRRELFEKLDRPAMMSLPVQRYEIGRWGTRKVNIDYHIPIEKHFYSVPYQLVHEQVETRVSATTLEVFHKGKRVASHRLSHVVGGYTTVPEHMPESHRRHAQWTPSRVIDWASKVGPKTADLAERIMSERPHPEQGYRACLGIMRLGREYGVERLEAACARALAIGARSYGNVKSILENGLDRQPLPGKSNTEQEAIEHENVRGPDYYN